MITPLRGDEPDLTSRVERVRQEGHVPLIGDPRWSTQYWNTMVRAAREAELPAGTAWATLTSGSSGNPRIVLRTHASWAESFAAVSELLGVGNEAILSLPAPAASSLSLFSLAHSLEGGPKPHFSLSSDADALHGTPQALRALLEADAPSRVGAALIGGSHLDPAVRQRAAALGIRVTSYYGAAELSFVACDRGEGLVPFPGVDVEIREGILWVRSPYVALGYAGAAGPLRREGTWATVGDRAELVDGRLRLLGRSDDAILSASATIVPEEVEAVLRAIPGVRDALVFGMPREPIGALVSALVELDDDAAVSLRELSAAGLAPAHRPRRWYSGPIPRTSSGKPARAEVLRMIADREVHLIGK